MFDQVNQLAQQLFQQHGLVNYSFGFDRAIRRAGLCNYSQKRITISRHLVEAGDMHVVEQVLLHEIAHALVGKKHNHDAVWKAKAQATVDNAHMRYYIVHLHRLLDPEAPGSR